MCIKAKRMSEEVCKKCDHQECCFIYQDLNDGREWYKKYYGLKRICPNFKERVVHNEEAGSEDQE